MAETFRKVTPGEPFEFPAGLYNRLVDLAVAHGNPEQNNESAALFRQTGIVKVRNDSGADRGQFEVVGLDVPLITPVTNLDQFKQQVAMSGISPTSTAGKFAVLIEPIKSTQIGRAIASGVTICQVNMSDAAHTFAESSSGVYANLVSGTTGSARIFWAEGGTGVKWAIIRIDG